MTILHPLIAIPVKVFVGFGGKEGGTPAVTEKIVSIIRQVESIFGAAGYDNLLVRFVVEPYAPHTESAREKRLPDARTFLFGDWKKAALFTR